MFEPAAIEGGIALLNSNRFSTNDDNSFFIARFMNSLLQQEQVLAFLVALHARNVLVTFLDELVRRLKAGEGQKNWMEVATRLLGTIVVIGSQCFLQHLKDYPKILQAAQDNKRVFQWIEQNSSKYAMKVAGKWQVIKDLLMQIWRIEGIHQNFARRKEINVFIADQLLPANAHNSLEQIAFTWMKEMTEKIQAEKAENLCCKIHFKRDSRSQTEKFGQSNNQEFKDYRWPLENESIVNHLAKTVVSFLNTAGGIIFVGMKEDKDKMIQATGIKFKAEERTNFLYFMHDNIMRRVFPKTPEEQSRERVLTDQKGQVKQARKELEKLFTSRDYEYRISKYVYVDFMEVYEGNTMLYSKEDGSDFCIVRIKVKTGDPCELYHIINDNNIPQAYFREDKSVKKKSMAEFYEHFFKRMKNTKETPTKDETHENCRFHPKTYDPPRFR